MAIYNNKAVITTIIIKNITDAEKVANMLKPNFDSVHIFENYKEGREFISAPDYSRVCIIAVP